ncbi:MAG: cadherin-like beta sandwich domain-containing protein [Bacteroidales bacterium]|nr:cadherin-like beta sandwich domain-containing protein [Bacteroidales bacterium]
MVYTTSQATVARGITVKIGNDVITEITDDGVPIPQTEVDDIEVTNQDSGDWKEYKAGRKDGGECEIKANAVDGDAGQSALAAAATSGATVLFTVTFPSGSVLTFYGTVKTYDHVVEDQILRISSKVKVSGAPTFSTATSALTGMAITAQSMSPSFAPAKFKYICSVVTGTAAVVVVPTQAAVGSAITVNGVSVASGGNGSVNLGSAGTITEIDVVVKELSKAASIYHITVFRA